MLRVRKQIIKGMTCCFNGGYGKWGLEGERLGNTDLITA